MAFRDCSTFFEKRIQEIFDKRGYCTIHDYRVYAAIPGVKVQKIGNLFVENPVNFHWILEKGLYGYMLCILNSATSTTDEILYLSDLAEMDSRRASSPHFDFYCISTGQDKIYLDIQKLLDILPDLEKVVHVCKS